MKIQYSVQSDATLTSAAYNYVGKTFKPDWDMYIWLLAAQRLRPAQRLGYFTTDQIQGNNDAAWSDPQYDQLFKLQETTLDQQKRKQIVWQMEKIFYEQTPYVVLDYPKLLEGWNTASWTGWERIPQPDGAVAFITDNVDNYRLVGPKAAVATSGGMSGGAIAGIVIAVVVVVGLAVWLVTRRRRASPRRLSAMVSVYPPIVVDVYRGSSVESRHELVASVVDAEGREVARYGNPDFSTYWRSSAKPFQARPWVDGGTVEHFSWGEREIAIMCASHVGSDVHAGLVRRMLADIGLSEADLRCDHDLKACQNCSGNHTGCSPPAYTTAGA